MIWIGFSEAGVVPKKVEQKVETSLDKDTVDNVSALRKRAARRQ